MISGSARLNVYKKGGDSMMGRYYFRLHPFSVAEILDLKLDRSFFENIEKLLELNFVKNKTAEKILKNLMTFGGFPEPFLKQDKLVLRRWQNNRLEKIVKEDIRDLNNIKSISLMEILVRLLPEKAGSLLSINNIANDLGVSHKTAGSWLDILENFYYHFRLYPYQNILIKSLRKEPKIFMNDCSIVKNKGAKFENLIATHLLKFVHYLYDVWGYRAELILFKMMCE